MRSSGSSNKAAVRFWQVALFIVFLAIWHVATSPTLLPPLFRQPAQGGIFLRRTAQGAGAHLGLVLLSARSTPISG